MKELRKVRVPGIGGAYEVVFGDGGVVAVTFPGRRSRCWTSCGPAAPADPLAREIREAFASWARGGDAPRNLPVDMGSGTPFQRKVWGALRGIPRGSTRTYGDVAAAIGRPRAARAVGRACSANPAPVVIPCHRVVSATGLGGFGPGPAWKRRLLKAEGL